MLKNVLYGLLFAGTMVRLTDIIFLLTKGNTSLPMPVLVVTSMVILYGLFLIISGIIGKIQIQRLLTFYVLQAAATVFNLAFIAVMYPLQVSFLEALVVGSFLDIIIDVYVIYVCAHSIRAMRVPSVRVIGESRIGNVSNV